MIRGARNSVATAARTYRLAHFPAEYCAKWVIFASDSYAEVSGRNH